MVPVPIITPSPGSDLSCEIAAIVLDEHVVLMERVGVHQRDDALTGRQLTHRFLLFDGLGSASEADAFFPLLEFENFIILY